MPKLSTISKNFGSPSNAFFPYLLSSLTERKEKGKEKDVCRISFAANLFFHTDDLAVTSFAGQANVATYLCALSWRCFMGRRRFEVQCQKKRTE